MPNEQNVVSMSIHCTRRNTEEDVKLRQVIAKMAGLSFDTYEAECERLMNEVHRLFSEMIWAKANDEDTVRLEGSFRAALDEYSMYSSLGVSK